MIKSIAVTMKEFNILVSYFFWNLYKWKPFPENPLFQENAIDNGI